MGKAYKKILSLLVILTFVFSITNVFALEATTTTSLKLNGSVNETNVKMKNENNLKFTIKNEDDILKLLETTNNYCDDCEEYEKIVEEEAPKGFGLFWMKLKLKFTRSSEVKFDSYVRLGMKSLVEAKKYYAKGEKEKALEQFEEVKVQLKKAEEYLNKLEEDYNKNPTKEKAKRIVKYKNSLDAFQKAITAFENRIQNSNLSEEEKQKILPLIEELKTKLKLHKNNLTYIKYELKEKLNLSDEEETEIEYEYNYDLNVSSKVILERTQKEYERISLIVEKTIETLNGKNLTEEQENDLNKTLTLLNESKILLEEAKQYYEEGKYKESIEKSKEAHMKLVEVLRLAVKYKHYLEENVMIVAKYKDDDIKEMFKERREKLKELREKLEEKRKEMYKEMKERKLKEDYEDKYKKEYKEKYEEKYRERMNDAAKRIFGDNDSIEVKAGIAIKEEGAPADSNCDTCEVWVDGKKVND